MVLVWECNIIETGVNYDTVIYCEVNQNNIIADFDCRQQFCTVTA